MNDLHISNGSTFRLLRIFVVFAFATTFLPDTKKVIFPVENNLLINGCLFYKSTGRIPVIYFDCKDTCL